MNKEVIRRFLPLCKNNLRPYSASSAADDSILDDVALELSPAEPPVADNLYSIFGDQHCMNPTIHLNVSVSMEILSFRYSATFKLGRWLAEAVNTFYSMKDTFWKYLTGVRAKPEGTEGIEKLLQLYKRMKTAGIQPTGDTYDFVIDAMCRCGQITCAHSVFADMIDSGCKPTTLTFNNLMSVHLEDGRAKKVLQLYKQMQTFGIQANAHTYIIVIYAFYTCDQITRAHDKLDEMLSLGYKPSAATFNNLMYAHINAGRTNKVLQLYKRMKAYGIRPTEESYNVVIRVLCGCGQITCAYDIFVEMLYSGFKPNEETFISWMGVHVNAGRTNKVLQLHKQMKTYGIRPTVKSYDVVIDALCESGQITRAHDKFVEMLYSGCQPSEYTFHLLMWAHDKAGRTKNVLQLYKQMKAFGIQPTGYTCDFVIKAFCRRGQITRALAEMLDSGEPDLMAYNLLIYTLCFNSNRAMALKVLNTMIKNGCKPNPWSFNPIFVCDACNGDINSAYRLFLRMKQAKCRPDTDTYNILLQILEESESADMVIKMWKEMVECEVEEDVYLILYKK